MPNEVTEHGSVENEIPPPSAATSEAAEASATEIPRAAQPAAGGQECPVIAPDAVTPSAPGPQTEQNNHANERFQFHLKNSSAGILTTLGDHSQKYQANLRFNKSTADFVTAQGEHGQAVNVAFHTGTGEAKAELDTLLMIEELQSSGSSYRSLEDLISGYSGLLMQEQILLLSCHHEEVIANAARSLASGVRRAAVVQWITLDKDAPGGYKFRELVELLIRRNGKSDETVSTPIRVCIWDATDFVEGDLTHAILVSLLGSQAGKIASHRSQLGKSGICMICLLPPEQIKKYKKYKSEKQLKSGLREWEIDFLQPLLEDRGHESLFDEITHQRKGGKWEKDDADFYKQIVDRLRDGTLETVVASGGPQPSQVVLPPVEQLFDRSDPLVEALIYCATYFPNLSPQDFSLLVELYLGDTTEEIVKQNPSSKADDDETPPIVESVPLVRRWRRDTDAILRRCKLAPVTNENKRVIDFRPEGLRELLRGHIRDEHYYFYESSFNLLRERGILFSPRREMAEGSRRLFVEIAAEYAADEVAAWLYQVIAEFDELAGAVDLLKGQSTLLNFMPDSSLKVARHYVLQGLTLLLIRLQREPKLQDAVRLFWKQLVRNQHQWFLDLLRRMGSVPPPETFDWLKQILDHGVEDIRRQAADYLLRHLLRQDSTVFGSLTEIIQWPATGGAGKASRVVLITYFVAVNSQVPQSEYGKWPSSHALFGFEDVDEAKARLDSLIGWLFDAACTINPDHPEFPIAEVLAGWFFVLSAPPSPNADVARADGDVLDARRVRELLLASAVARCSRVLKGRVLEQWADMKSDILNEIIQIESIANQITDSSLSADLTLTVATVRRKLMDTRTLLSDLRRDFLTIAERVEVQSHE